MDKRSLIFVFVLIAAFYFIHNFFDKKEENRIKERQVSSTYLQKEEAAPPIAYKPQVDHATTAGEEALYILENEYQQLVFSTIGGALIEINLPMQTHENPSSVVRAINFDKVMESDYPSNDYFPSRGYTSYKGTFPKGTLGGYYPLLRRGILSRSGENIVSIPPNFYALNTISEDPATAKLHYQVTKLEKDVIEFETVESNRRITKTYTLPKNPLEAPYCFELSIKIDGDARGLQLTSGVPEVELVSGNFTPNIKYLMSRGRKPQVEQIDLPKVASTISGVQPDWVSNSNGFFGIIIDPLTDIGTGFSSYNIAGNTDPTRLTLIDAHYKLYPADKYPGYEVYLPLRSSNQLAKFRIYAGPFEDDLLKIVDATFSDPARGYNPNYILAMSFQGWFTFISEPFAKFLFMLMKFFYQITSSWGISIILLTAALRLMLYPLNGWSIKSSLKMQHIAPQVSAIQAKYKKDPKRSQLEIMTLYREKGVNPLTGCFPILIQIPFLIGMFDLLKSTFELRGASFIPGWIDNLSAPDVLFSWGYPVMFFGTEFHLLPIILGAVMYFQQKISSPLPKDTSQLTDQQKQQKLMGNIMTIVFAVMFYHFPSGLNLYWLSSMVLGIVQQWYMTKKMKKAVSIPK
ncbi:MAG: membrane protein insertase YidC [Chlamydiota bacterium]